MCGISGIVNGAVSIYELSSFQHHRGPDNLGVCNAGDGVKLAHNRLSIIDLSESGNQPLQGERYSLVYNGEIYNYKDFYSGKGNDAHALLDSIEKRGVEHTLRIINGMFAFAVYDRVERKLHLCVDRFGQKPLYYYPSESGPNVFAFASSPAALLPLQNKWYVSESGLQSYWALGGTMGITSIWGGIYRVEAATHLVYDLNTHQRRPTIYWTPEYKENTKEIVDLVIDAIEKVKVSDVPVSIFLSGGIDSTVVASCFQGGDAIHLESHEQQYAVQVANRFGINLRVVSPKKIDVAECLSDYSKKCGEPTMAGIIPYITAREVSKYCKVAITANGADELFFGYDRTNDEITGQQLSHIFRRYDGMEMVDRLHNLTYQLPKGISHGRWVELMTYVQHDLNKTLDFASMAHSLEMRSPFLDHRLVEMALSIPQEKHGRKEILKNILRGYGFKEDFLQRPKHGFSLSVKPENIEALKNKAYDWCKKEGWLKCGVQTGRDLLYTKMSALGFYYWYQTFKHKIA